MRLLLFLVSFLIFTPVFSQESKVITGRVLDENGNSLSGATLINLNTKKGILADSLGSFRLIIQTGEKTRIEVSFIGYQKDTFLLPYSNAGNLPLIIRLKPQPGNIGEVVVESVYDRAEALQQINIRTFEHIPLPSGNVESILTTLGVSSRNEMSSQYSVRGGNFDENLIYVNGVEIYRPLLVKSGQQEGMSFINPSLVSSVQFAAGGFDARYGDKMSSVLDIRYKRPNSFRGSASAGLLGMSAHIEGNKPGRLTHITGIRYKSNQYLLHSLETEGDYKPSFFDIQTFITYDLSKKLEINFLGNVAVNNYKVIPQSRVTSFGTYQQPMNFTVYYEGQEKDRFTTMLGALNVAYKTNDKLNLKFTASGFNTFEKIAYDILGEYRIDLLDNTPGSETAGDSILNLGYGGDLKHARNYLDADIFTLDHKGSWLLNDKKIDWGLSAQYESFDSQMKEWQMIDSAGYSVPFSDDRLELQHVIRSKNYHTAFRYKAFLNTLTNLSAGNAEILLNTGFRINYLTTNRQFLISPRFSAYFIPDWKRKVSFHAALGWYHQPPFYKEMIDPQGKIHKNTRAQESVHIVLGSDWEFSLWDRPFKFSAETYYKKLNHLIPYIIDDVDIQYLPQYNAKGYAAGIEFKLNGEFVKDAESWASLSFLRTREDRKNDDFGAYPRLTDQLVNFGLYFQDYFPNNPSYRLHLHIYYGSRLPYNSTEYDNPQKYYHLQSYKRIDIGLSKSLFTNREGKRINSGRIIDDLWFSFEIFNLFGFKNQASYEWVKTVSNQEGFPNQFAVPNYLTGRLLNVRISINF